MQASMGRRIFAIILLLLAVCIASTTFILPVTPSGNRLLASVGITLSPAPSRPPVPLIPAPTPTPRPVLTVKGTPPKVQATAIYLMDMDTGNVLIDTNGEKPLAMASTTKVMTALIAIQTA